VRLDAMIDIM